MEKKRVVVNIFGKEYSLVSEVNPEYVIRAAAYVDSKMKEVAEAYPNIIESRIAVLAAMNISDELFKALEGDHDLTDTEQALSRLARRLSEVL